MRARPSAVRPAVDMASANMASANRASANRASANYPPSSPNEVLGHSPPEQAAYMGHEKAAELLLKAGAPPNGADDQGGLETLGSGAWVAACHACAWALCAFVLPDLCVRVGRGVSEQ